MTEPVRRAGTGRRPDGMTVTWTVAEGRRGRRWRETVIRAGTVAWSLLYETDAAGRFSHLELATAVGLATLHPEPGATLHGNTVDRTGVHHIRGMPFPPGSALVVSGSTVAGAAIAWSGAAPGEGTTAIAIDPATLALRSRRLVAADLVPVDASGAPLLADAASWPLEDPDP